MRWRCCPGRCGADVTVSLPFEPGGWPSGPWPACTRACPSSPRSASSSPRSTTTTRPARAPALHQVERGLFERDPPRAGGGGRGDRLPRRGRRAGRGGAGRRRACSTSCAGHLARRRGGGFRDPTRYSSLVEQVFGAYGVPYSLDRSLPFAHTGLGRGLLALIRCARRERQRRRPPRLPAHPRAPHAARAGRPARGRACARTARTAPAQARALWESEHWRLTTSTGWPAPPTRRRTWRSWQAVLARLFAAPYQRRAPVLAGPELDDPRVFRAGQQALAELRALLEHDGAAAGPRAGGTRARRPAACTWARTRSPTGSRWRAPEAIRARRFEAVLVLGLQEGEFPGGSPPEPFLPDDVRREIAKASGLVLPLREDQLDRERYLFYVCASRAERVLVLSSRTSDEEGSPRRPPSSWTTCASSSPAAAPRPLAGRRDLDAGGRAHRRGVGPRPGRARAAARGAPSRARSPRSRCWPSWRSAARCPPAALERFADCPVKWLVENVLRPRRSSPTPSRWCAAQLAHAVLERTYMRLRDETGDPPRDGARTSPTPSGSCSRSCDAARSEFRISPEPDAGAGRRPPARVRPAAPPRGRGRADGTFEPELSSCASARASVEHDPVEIGDGLLVSGRIDRVDTSDGMALVIDYKSGRRVDSLQGGELGAGEPLPGRALHAGR